MTGVIMGKNFGTVDNYLKYLNIQNGQILKK